MSAAGPAEPPLHDAASARLAETVRFTYGYMPAALAGYMAGVGVVAMLFWGLAPMSLLLPWMAAFTVMCAVRIVIVGVFKRAEAAESAHWTLADWRRWIWRANIGAIIAASGWGLAGWLFYNQGTALEQTGLIVIVYTFCAVGIPVLSIQRRLYLVFAALVFLPLLARIAMVGDRFHYLLAGELVMIIGFTFVLANS